jgi:hypothetical protein
MLCCSARAKIRSLGTGKAVIGTGFLRPTRATVATIPVDVAREAAGLCSEEPRKPAKSASAAALQPYRPVSTARKVKGLPDASRQRLLTTS